MRRQLAAALAVAVTALGITFATAAPAAAAPSLRCGTADWAIPDIYAEAGGQIIILGTFRSSYVGSYYGIGGTYRYWHNTYTSNNTGTTSYRGAVAVKCNAANEELSDVDLSRDTLTAADHPKCGTISYTVGDNSYTYIGSRTTEGDRFRYWGQSISFGNFFFRGPSAVRCD